MSSLNLAARAGGWSAAHWKTATVIWIVFVIVAMVAGRRSEFRMLTDLEQTTGETARAETILASAGFRTPASEIVLVESRSVPASSPEFRATVRG